MTSPTFTSRLRPPRLADGISGSINCHSYRLDRLDNATSFGRRAYGFQQSTSAAPPIMAAFLESQGFDDSELCERTLSISRPAPVRLSEPVEDKRGVMTRIPGQTERFTHSRYPLRAVFLSAFPRAEPNL